jgi:alpha-tubulin suppressor-like RCC1 family protein
MKSARTSSLAETRKLLIAGAALSAACTLALTAALTPAQAQAQTQAQTQGQGTPPAATGTIEHWGIFAGDGDQFDKKLSPAPLTLPGAVAQVSSSNDAQYALLTNGTVYAWGQGSDGELGDGKTVDSFTKAEKVTFPAGVKIAFLPVDVMPFDSAFAVDTTGHVWAWGLNQGSEFCQGAATKELTPVELSLTGVTTLAGASDHATYDSDGTVYSCGINTYGELGNGTTKSSKTPVKVSGLDGADVTTLVASFGDTGALLDNGTYYDWGENNSGQVGNRTTTNAEVPVKVTLPATVRQAAQGGSLATNGQTIALLANGALYAWGSDSSYQLGDGKTANETSPELIAPPTGVTYQTLASGGGTSYGITADGGVYAWGNNKAGEVGNGTTTNAPVPVLVESGQSLISATADDVVTSPGS